MVDYIHPRFFFFFLEGAYHELVAGERIIQYLLDIDVVFQHRTPLVEVCGLQILRAKNDKYGT
jgi:hypothetical protein